MFLSMCTSIDPRQGGYLHFHYSLGGYMHIHYGRVWFPSPPNLARISHANWPRTGLGHARGHCLVA
jgi:hypothetical protein